MAQALNKSYIYCNYFSHNYFVLYVRISDIISFAARFVTLWAFRLFYCRTPPAARGPPAMQTSSLKK